MPVGINAIKIVQILEKNGLFATKAITIYQSLILPSHEDKGSNSSVLRYQLVAIPLPCKR
jgi:hypothetical protein